MSSIPYLDNIETTLMKIFAETPEISGKNRDLRYNRNYSNYNIELLHYYFRLIDFIVVVKLLGEFISDKRDGGLSFVTITRRSL